LTLGLVRLNFRQEPPDKEPELIRVLMLTENLGDPENFSTGVSNVDSRFWRNDNHHQAELRTVMQE